MVCRVGLLQTPAVAHPRARGRMLPTRDATYAHGSLSRGSRATSAGAGGVECGGACPPPRLINKSRSTPALSAPQLVR